MNRILFIGLMAWISGAHAGDAANDKFARSGTSNEQSNQVGKNSVFGSDDRVEVDQYKTAYHWTAPIGRLNTPNGGWCSASLVWHNLIITAQHCIKDTAGELVKGNYRFRTYYKNGNFDRESTVEWFWWGGDTYNSDRSQDWAILRLTENLGDHYGWFGTKSLGFDEIRNQYIHTLGFNGDYRFGEVLTIHEYCQVTYSDSAGIYRTNCDTNQGNSGGPVVLASEPSMIVAVDSASPTHPSDVGYRYRETYTHDMANIHTTAANFGAKIGELRLEFPR